MNGVGKKRIALGVRQDRKEKKELLRRTEFVRKYSTKSLTR